jgi:hypothetical protein
MDNFNTGYYTITKYWLILELIIPHEVVQYLQLLGGGGGGLEIA